MKRWPVAFVGILAASMMASAFGGCAFSDLRNEKAAIDSSFALMGQVRNPSLDQGQVIVILFSEKDGSRVPVRYALPERTGHFSFLVNSGVYFLAAFEDVNENLDHDPWEYAGYYGAPSPVATPALQPGHKAAKSIKRLDIHLGPTDSFVDGMEMTADLEVERMPLFRIGAIVQLEDAIFDQANGGLGYWKPLTFAKRFGVGIYFLEPYDPQRTPVLFVHGASGTPAGWKELSSCLDKERYQTWFYYYPSGLHLDDSVYILNYIVDALQEEFGFNRLYITAHSMGGLVSRGAILVNRYRYNRDYIKLFVSISTPWGGIAMAQKGLDRAPASIPSWHDVAPNSEFIRKIYKQPLPPDMPFHLFFSHQGNCSLFMGNNDGIVELNSELDYRAQAEATSRYGFDEDHTGILTSTEMIERYRTVLNSAP